MASPIKRGYRGHRKREGQRGVRIGIKLTLGGLN